MRVLVTGANGYVGQAVMAALRTAGHDPVAMVRGNSSPTRADGRPSATGGDEARVGDLIDSTRSATGRDEVRDGDPVDSTRSATGRDEVRDGDPVDSTRSAAGRDEVRVGDLADGDSLRRAVAGMDAVCHLAGLGRARESVTEPLRYFRVNTGGTLALLEAMAAGGVRRIVFASTGSIYGTPERQPMAEDCPDDPPHPYASSKLAAEYAIEAQARDAGIGAIILRLSNIAGGADPDPTRLIPRALSAALERTPLTVNGDGTSVRDYVHVSDAAAAFAASLSGLPAPGESRRYNIGSGRGTSILDVAAAVERVTGLPVPLVHGPAAAEPRVLISDPTRAMRELGWAAPNSGLDTIIEDCWRRHSN